MAFGPRPKPDPRGARVPRDASQQAANDFRSRLYKVLGLAAVAGVAGWLSYQHFEGQQLAQPLPELAVPIAPGESPWIALGETPAMTLYWDRSSRSREAQVMKVWEIQDMQAPDPDGVRSRRYRNEYDCKHRMHRLSDMTSYAGPMLTGQKLFDLSDEGYWRKAPPGSVFALGMALHCGQMPPQEEEKEKEKAPWWAPFWPF